MKTDLPPVPIPVRFARLKLWRPELDGRKVYGRNAAGEFFVRSRETAPCPDCSGAGCSACGGTRKRRVDSWEKLEADPVLPGLAR